MNSNFKRLEQLNVPAPKADAKPHSLEFHNQTLSDDYHWLRDPNYPECNDSEILDYLSQENRYFEAFLKPHQTLVDTLFEEFKGREEESESSVPFVYRGYEYRWAFNKGGEYRQYYRRHLETDVETLFLDQESMAKGHDYFVLGDWTISPDNRFLAYAIDTNGDERYTLYIKDLVTGTILPNCITDVAGSLIFNSESNAIVFAKLNKDSWKTQFIVYCLLSDIAATKPDESNKIEEHVVVEEADDGFFMAAGLSSSEEFIIISSGNSSANEIHALPSSLVSAKPITLVKREQKMIVTADHAHNRFYFLANDTHVNARFVSVSDKQASFENWETFIAGSDAQYLKNFALFDEHIVIQLSELGQDRLRIIKRIELQGDGQSKSSDALFPETLYSIALGHNSEMSQGFVRVHYESMVTPSTVYDLNLNTLELSLKKQKTIPSGYDKSLYITERLMAKSRDGSDIPISIVYKKGFKQDSTHPMHLYAYGAYGIGMTPDFSTMDLSLLDRGFSFAIAHVRGGDEMGYQWYLDGKLDKRNNAFNDFIDVADYLIEQKYVSKGNISISGRSAGGEMMGVMITRAPEYWRSVILGVPFVDVLNTMLDETLPLTPPEWEEWGNPISDPKAFDLIKSYSPYDNIEAKEYPPMLVTGGLNDPRVTYWEPAKWTAKMRATKTDSNLLVMRMNMGAGHFANSGRYGRLKDYAQEMAFQLLSHGVKV
jgi:oligopeptidase B